MKIIKPNDLPRILTEDIVNILAEMADEMPQSQEWKEIFILLSHDDLRRIFDKKIEIQRRKTQEKYDLMSDEEKAEEAAKWEKLLKNKDPHKFYGNMGQPETPGEYKNRYGTYPPGYDDQGNKIKKE